MAESVKVCPVSAIPEGTMKTIVVQGKRLAIACVSGEYFAFDDTCSHEECSLGTEGFIDGQKVVCGCHGAHFDMKTGNALSLPATQPIQSYSISIQSKDIYILL